jgi:hypothetical protein
MLGGSEQVSSRQTKGHQMDVVWVVGRSILGMTPELTSEGERAFQERKLHSQTQGKSGDAFQEAGTSGSGWRHGCEAGEDKGFLRCPND